MVSPINICFLYAAISFYYLNLSWKRILAHALFVAEVNGSKANPASPPFELYYSVWKLFQKFVYIYILYSKGSSTRIQYNLLLLKEYKCLCYTYFNIFYAKFPFHNFLSYINVLSSFKNYVIILKIPRCADSSILYLCLCNL